MNTCIRIYNNGDRVIQRCSPEDTERWIEGNKKWRPGTALFVNGKCHQTGYLGKVRCEEIEKELAISR